ncbi:MAG: transglutaminase-like domain-containing protein [Candidatus Asgardarchaeia archaeon]
MEPYLEPTKYVDITQEIRRFAERLIEGSTCNINAAIRIFNFIRDLKFGASPIYKASEVLRNRNKPLICVSKAILQVALYRSIGIPSRFHTWKVKFSDETVAKINNLLFSKSKKKFRGDRIIYHVAAEVYLDKWIVADATIDSKLNKVFDVHEWNGRDDYLLKGFTFLEDLGTSKDVPKLVLDVTSGKGLPVHLRVIYPVLMKIFNRKLNSFLEKIRRDC